MNNLLSIIIPSRNEIFLKNTVEDLLDKSESNIEIIAVLDGYWPDPMPREDKRVVYLHRGKAMGMRAAINGAAQIAKGNFLMKCDAHCMFDYGYDIKLMNDCEGNWVIIPRRKRLDAENWDIQDVGKPDVDYEYLSYPYANPKRDPGIHGTIWTSRAVERLNEPEYLVDENMSFQGSCWFTTKKHFLHRIGGLQEEGYGTFIGEPQEIGMRTWLGGGKVMVNKKTWYAHLHKGKKYGRGYFMSKTEVRRGNRYSVNYWMNNNWEDRIHDIEWLIERFWPVPTWPEDRSLWKMRDDDEWKN